jgi:hypothetical protein
MKMASFDQLGFFIHFSRMWKEKKTLFLFEKKLSLFFLLVRLHNLYFHLILNMRLKSSFVPAEEVLAVRTLVSHTVQRVDTAGDTSARPEPENRKKKIKPYKLILSRRRIFVHTLSLLIAGYFYDNLFWTC